MDAVEQNLVYIVQHPVAWKKEEKRWHRRPVKPVASTSGKKTNPPALKLYSAG